ncbi:hypothetical protein PM082_009316 [Marasmius tenuissimus]|nr:hypothetical protein PM082_009316 [Marasmius tenuissimus]
MRTHTRTVTEQSPGKVITRTTTRTTVVTESPSRSSRASSSYKPTSSRQSTRHDDSDNPNEDATILFTTDLEPETASSSATVSNTYGTPRSTTRSQPSPPPSQASSPTSSPPTAESGDTEESLARFYEVRYPGKVPDPQTLRAPATTTRMFYVVTAGVEVRIFTDWNKASSLVTGISGAWHESQRRFYQAWLVYYKCYMSRSIETLDEYQNTAPLDMQLADHGLDDLVNSLSI